MALRFLVSARALGLVMAFGAGVLISAVAYELVHAAFETSFGDGGVALGFALGSATFFVGDILIARAGGGAAMSIVLGTVLDGIPESLVLGLTLLTVTA